MIEEYTNHLLELSRCRVVGPAQETLVTTYPDRGKYRKHFYLQRHQGLNEKGMIQIPLMTNEEYEQHNRINNTFFLDGTIGRKHKQETWRLGFIQELQMD